MCRFRDGTPGADGDHHEQAHAKAADGGGQDKGADAKGGADLPDEWSRWESSDIDGQPIRVRERERTNQWSGTGGSRDMDGV